MANALVRSSSNFVKQEPAMWKKSRFVSNTFRWDCWISVGSKTSNLYRAHWKHNLHLSYKNFLVITYMSTLRFDFKKSAFNHKQIIARETCFITTSEVEKTFPRGELIYGRWSHHSMVSNLLTKLSLALKHYCNLYKYAKLIEGHAANYNQTSIFS